MASKDKLVSVGNVGALVDQIPGLAVMAYNPLGELEDVKARAGSFKNAGEGWNTFTFPDSFDSAPTVYCQCDNYNVEVKTVTAESFIYRLVTLNATTTSSKVLTTTITYVSAVGWTTVADAVTINYMAISYGGD